MDYDGTLESLRAWASRHDAVRALVLTGSSAASTAHPLSDRDIEVFATDVPVLLADESWWSRLGDVLVVERLEDDDHNPTRLIYYAGGKLDFTLLTADKLVERTYVRPFEILLDKDGSAATASLVPQPAESPTTEHERLNMELHLTLELGPRRRSALDASHPFTVD